MDYEFNELDEISLAYATSIHKSQGSEYPVVVMPLAMQHYTLLERNLVYTGEAIGGNHHAAEGFGHGGQDAAAAEAVNEFGCAVGARNYA